MSMLETVRGTTDSSFIKLVFGGIVLSFVFWGVGGTGQKSSVIAEVNGTRITDTEFQRVMRQESYSRRGNLSDDQLKARQDEVVTQLIQKEVMRQEAQRLGIDVSDDEVAHYLRTIPAFRDENDQFSFALYERMLKSQGLNKSRFNDEIRDSLIQMRLFEFASMAAQVPYSELVETYQEENNLVSLAWVSLPSSGFRDEVEVSPADIDAYLAESLEEAQEVYERDKARRYTVPRKLTLRELVMKKELGDVAQELSMNAMDKLHEELVAGADFAELATRWSETASAGLGGDLGVLEETSLRVELKEALSEATVGYLSPVLDYSDQLSIVRVEAIEDAVVTPFEEVQREIAREQIARDRAPALAERVAQRLLESWKTDGEPDAELLEARELQVTESMDLRWSATSIPRLGPAGDIITDASAAESAQVLDKVYALGTSFVVAQAIEVKAADMEAFETQRTLLRERLLLQKKMEFIDSWSKDLVQSAQIQRYF